MGSVAQSYNLAQSLGIIGGSAAPDPAQPQPSNPNLAWFGMQPKPAATSAEKSSSDAGARTSKPSAQTTPYSQDTIDLIGKFLNAQQAERQTAQQNVFSAVGLHKLGFPINLKAFKRDVKKGFNDLIATDEKQLMVPPGEVGTGQQQTPFQQSMQGQPSPFGQQTALPRNPFQRNPDGTITAQSGAPPHVQDAVDVHNDLARGKAPNPAKVRGMFVKSIAHAAWGAIQRNLLPDQQKARNAMMIENMEGNILAHPDSPQAQKDLGTLMRMGQIPFNQSLEEWLKLSPEDRAQMARIHAGYLSPADKAKLSEDYQQQLGDVTDNPADAKRIADKWANGQDLSDEDRKLIKPSFARRFQALQVVEPLVEQGLIAPEDMSKAIDIWNSGGNPTSMIAPGVKPYAVQMMELKREEMGLENRLKIAELGAKMDAARLTAMREDREQHTADSEALLRAWNEFDRAQTFYMKNKDDPNALEQYETAADNLSKAPGSTMTYEELTESHWFKPDTKKIVLHQKPSEDVLRRRGVGPPSTPGAPQPPTAQAPTGDPNAPAALSGLGALGSVARAAAKKAMPLIGLSGQ